MRNKHSDIEGTSRRANAITGGSMPSVAQWLGEYVPLSTALARGAGHVREESRLHAPSHATAEPRASASHQSNSKTSSTTS
ncbi:hypothetical protein AB1N83_008806 [Pleurotus pulmonarius]